MKKILVVSIILLSALSGFAQKAVSLSLNAGIASPLGDFSKTDYADNNSGFAKTGFHINLDGIFHVSKCFGINVNVSNSTFGHKGLTNLSDGYKEDSGTDSTTLTTNGNNNIFSVLAGPVYSIKASPKLKINLRALGGYSAAKLSGFTIYYEDYTDNALTQNKSTAGGFGFMGGIGFCYQITKFISLKLNGDYFTVKPKFDISYDNHIVNSGRNLSEYNAQLSTFNTTLGIGINL